MIITELKLKGISIFNILCTAVNIIKTQMGKVVGHVTFNSLVVKVLDSQSRGPCSKPLSGSKLINWIPGISGNLVVKSKLPPRVGYSLEAVESHP